MRKLILAALAAGAAFGVTGAAHAEKTVCDGSTGPSGSHNNGFWTWFTINASGNDCIKMFDDTARHFEINWSLDGNGSDAVGGMGWSTGDAKAVISYNAGYWNASGKASLQLYGWTCNGTTPQEYYVVENWGSEKYVPWDPANGRLAKSLGTVKSDGGTYDIFKTKQINAGHGCGTGGKDFFQYWSVRTDRRPSGNQSITFANHAAAWAASKRGFYTKGVSKGYQVMGAEGLNTSSGTLNMTTWK